MRSAVLGGLAACQLSACAAIHLPDNNRPELSDRERTERTRVDAAGQRERLSRAPFGSSLKNDPSFVANVCPPAGTADYLEPGPNRPTGSVSNAVLTMRYSTGDRFNMQVPGAPDFSGDYVVNADGRVILPFAGEIPVHGLTNTELTSSIEKALIKAKLFEPQGFRIAVRPVAYAPVNITVSGAVFMRGRFTINVDHTPSIDARALLKTGDAPLGRFIPSALQAAGGVRPDADLSNVRLTRNGKTYVLNWRGALTGAPVDDVPLLNGDHIHVGEAACFQSALARPSQITPFNIRVFFSNLTAPGYNIAPPGRDAPLPPYGIRLLAAAVQANCVGGSLASNAGRYAVLITRNPKTQETEVIQRSIEELVLSPDRDKINPFLMPDDAVACYDSAITDAREVANTIGTLLSPAQTFESVVNTGVHPHL